MLCYAILYYTTLYYTILHYTTLYYILLYYTILYYTILYSSILHYTTLYYTILYYTILYYTILYYTILYYTILYYTILYYTILYYTILYYTILYYTILYYTILYYTILYYTILYYTILYYTILHMVVVVLAWAGEVCYSQILNVGWTLQLFLDLAISHRIRGKGRVATIWLHGSQWCSSFLELLCFSGSGSSYSTEKELLGSLQEASGYFRCALAPRVRIQAQTGPNPKQLTETMAQRGQELKQGVTRYTWPKSCTQIPIRSSEFSCYWYSDL